ncbi:hypothetical protein [Roseivivax sp. CAU 1761]
MALELFAVIVAGFAGAGAMLLLRRLTGGRIAAWLVPVGAGLAMLAATISSEYGWYARTSAGLPEGFAVADTVRERVWYRPWTYAAPMVTRFVAVDRAGRRPHPEAGETYLADLYFLARWRPVRAVQMMVDCGAGRRADPLRNGAAPVWRTVGPDDPIVAATCGPA